MTVFPICPQLKDQLFRVDQLVDAFGNYKKTVPVYGAILLNPDMTKVLVVKGYSSSTWGFPRGKVNKDEPEIDCAVREVLEETGYDCSALIRGEDAIQTKWRAQKQKLFIIHPVPESVLFIPKTRKEIQKIEWHDINSLPDRLPGAGNAKDGWDAMKAYGKGKGSNNKYFLVLPFTAKLKKWIAKKRSSSAPKSLSALSSIMGLAGAKTEAELLLNSVHQSAASNATVNPGSLLLSMLQGGNNNSSSPASGGSENITATTATATETGEFQDAAEQVQSPPKTGLRVPFVLDRNAVMASWKAQS